ncbi:MAG: tRNA (guanosine(37)-N1)-methyltransferase TrmD [Flavobacteriales bacterium]|nr:tRNA (guanosine(37)-N1)-methyltransferase TrmD [Flavobacteriales bacterium]
MRIDILSAVPDLLQGPFSESIVGRARKSGVVEVEVHDIRKWSTDKHGKIDDTPFGGGAGMVMAIQPIVDAIADLQSQRTYDEVIYLTPDGERLAQGRVNQLSLCGNLLLLCGHYKGIDQRIREQVITMELSIGDYVLSGGELAAAVLADALVRLVPGAIGDGESALTDSFQDGLLAPPVYTRPAEWQGHPVPDVLLGGHHAEIEKWRMEQALERTQRLRPDLLDEA